MDDQNLQDPLEYFHGRHLFQPLSEADQKIIESAKNAIDNIKQVILTREIHEKYQKQLKEIIDISPHKVVTASYLLECIGEKSLAEIYFIFRNGCEVVKTGGRGRPKRTKDESEDGEGEDKTETKSIGRSTTFSRNVKSRGICQVTGAFSDQLTASHILPFAASNKNEKAKQYLELIKALFGPDALQCLLENVLNRNKDPKKNINRLDNGIAMEPTVHGRWDGMYFYLEVLWDSYDSSTKEFTARFHWITSPQSNMYNYWNPPLFLTPSGPSIRLPLADGDIIYFRRQNSPSSTTATTPSSTSTPSPISALPPDRGTKPTLPSAHLLYVREILTRIAHAVGAAGYPEYDYDDYDDDVSVLASDPGEEETSKLGDPEQAEEKTSQERMSQEEISQVAAWAEMSSSFIEEQRNTATQNEGCIDEQSNTVTQNGGSTGKQSNTTPQDESLNNKHPKTTARGKDSVGKQPKMPMLGKRRRSWTLGMKLAPVEEIQPGFRSSQSTRSGTGSDSDSDAGPLGVMDGRLSIAI